MKKYKYRILITGVAGFIGCHLAKKLISEENIVVGPDNINDSLATKEWGWKPNYNLSDTIQKYLVK